MYEYREAIKYTVLNQVTCVPSRKGDIFEKAKPSHFISLFESTRLLLPAIIGPNATGPRLQTKYSRGWQ